VSSILLITAALRDNDEKSMATTITMLLTVAIHKIHDIGVKSNRPMRMDNKSRLADDERGANAAWLVSPAAAGHSRTSD